MPDATNTTTPDRGRRPASGWDEAFARLPVETPPAEAWQRVAAALDGAGRVPRAAGRSGRRRFGGWLALAATLALAVALPWRQPGTATDGPQQQPLVSVDAPATTTVGAPPTVAGLRKESALLEILLAHARDGRVASGSAAAMAAELEARVAAVDAALSEPGLAPDRELALWNERVEALQALASFEGTRRWLAANGAQYDGVLVQVN